MRFAIVLACVFVGMSLEAAQAPVPAGWPTGLPIGMIDDPNDAAALVQAAPFAMRYNYLSGGANTGSGWSTWNSPSGDYARIYIQKSIDSGVVPMLVYYQILQSNPHSGADEAAKDLGNFANLATMQAWFADLTLLFQKAGAFTGKLVVVNIEPDFWGHLEQAAVGGDPTTVSGKVGACGGDVAGFANNAAGLAQAISHLRDLYAPNVAFGFHASVWGTNWDLLSSTPKADDAKASALGVQAGNFYHALGANYDLLFGEFSDRDAAFYQYTAASTTSWYHDDDYRHLKLFMASLTATAGKRIVLWQIPIGNTRMRSCDNSSGHYQSNQVEWLLDDPSRVNLGGFVDAGVIGFLFGAGASGCTVAGDADADGVTNPAPLAANALSTDAAANDIQSVSGGAAGSAPVYNAGAKTLTTPYAADDDGGFLKWKARDYYTTGAIALDPGTPTSGGGGSSNGGSSSGGGGGGCGHGAAAALALLASAFLMRRERLQRQLSGGPGVRKSGSPRCGGRSTS